MKSKNQEIIDVFNYRYSSVRNLTKIEKSAMKILIQLWNLQDFHQAHSDLSHGKFLLLKNEKMKEDFREFAWGAINSINGASHIVIVLARKGVTADSKHMEHMLEDVKKVPEEMKAV